MRTLLNRLFLLFLCSHELLQIESPVLMIICFLTALVLSCLLDLLPSMWAKYSLVAAYAFLCLVEPWFTIYLPLLMYDLFCNWRFWQLFFLLPLVSFFPAAAPECGIYYSFLLVLSFYLACMTTRQLKLEQTLLHLRDDSTELTNLLKSRNKYLRENQDNEINMAVLKERNRIAREIHDNVGHMLSRSLLQLGALQVSNREETLKEPLSQLRDSLDQAMNNIRSSVHDLHDDAIDMKSAIDGLLAPFAQYEIHLDYDLSSQIPNNIKYCFLTTLKECLTNITRHSDATRINIVFREHPSLYQCVIADNGTECLHPSKDGIGLNNIRERVATLNGVFHIRSDDGFQVFLSLPKQQNQENTV